jgi:MscS family membrane protein
MEQYIKWFPGWENEYLGFNQGTLGILLVLVLVSIIFRLIAMTIVTRVFSKITKLSPLAAKTISESRGVFGVAAAAALFWQLSEQLALNMDLETSFVMMPKIAVFWLPALSQLLMLGALLAWALKEVALIGAVVNWWADEDGLDGTEKTLISALESVLRFLIVIFGAMLIANALNFNLATLIAGMGISGLALALAAKDTISNFFGAITVLIDRPFKVGDWILTKNVEGEVLEIGLRTTLLRTGADTIITLPNANLVNQAVENYGKRRWRRYQPSFHLDIDSSPDKVQTFCNDILKIIIDNQQTTNEKSSWACVEALGPQSVDVNINMYWDISSGKTEREARELFLLSVMKLAVSIGLNFYEPRVRRQHSN